MIYIIQRTEDDGKTWTPLTKLGYYEGKENAEVEVEDLNKDENGELTRFEVLPIPARAEVVWNEIVEKVN